MYTCRQNTPIHNIKINLKEKKMLFMEPEKVETMAGCPCKKAEAPMEGVCVQVSRFPEISA